MCSVVLDSAIPWTVAGHAPLSMEFSRQECWRPFPTPGAPPYSKRSSQPWDRTCVSCVSCLGGRSLDQLRHLASPLTQITWRESRCKKLLQNRVQLLPDWQGGSMAGWFQSSIPLLLRTTSFSLIICNAHLGYMTVLKMYYMYIL